MAESSSAPAEPFPRGRLVVGIVLLLVFAAAASYVASRWRTAPEAGSVVFTDSGRLHVLVPVTGARGVITDLPQGASVPVASHDGRRYAYGHEGRAWWFESGGGDLRTLGDGVPLAFAPDGSVTVERPTPQGRTTLVNVAQDSSEQTIMPQGFAGPDGPPVWVDRDLVAVRVLDRSGEAANLMLISIGDGSVAVDHLIPDARPLASSPDGAQLLVAIAAGDGERLEVVDTDTGRGRPLGPRGSFTAAAASPAGVLAVAGSLEDGRSGVFSFGAGSEDAVFVVEADVAALAWMLDGTRLAFADSVGEIHTVPAVEGAQPTSLGVRTDSRWIAVVP